MGHGGAFAFAAWQQTHVHAPTQIPHPHPTHSPLQTATPTLLEVLDALAGTAVVDAAWSPTNESALVAADADGRLALYQLGRDAVDPTLLLPSPGDAPFTRLRWAPHGRALAVGDAAGGVYLAAVHADLVDTPPGGDAAALLAHYVDARGSRF